MPSKEEEAYYFAAFGRARPDLRLLDEVHADRPDFVGRLGAQRVALEVTRYSDLPEPGRPIADEQESLQQWTMRLAWTSYRALGGLPLHVDAYFNLSPPLTKKRAPEVARNIASFLQAHSKSLTIYRWKTFSDWSRDPSTPELGSLTVLRVPTEDHGVWYAGAGALVRHAQEQDVQRIVGRKEKKVAAYRRSCDEVWLLIAHDLESGTCVYPPEEPVSFSIRTAFDRVFCLAPIGDVCVEVPTRPLVV